MPANRRKTPASPWPFWLLLVAWFCASYPLAAGYAVVWLGKSHTFSHQQRLTAQVARVIGGEKAPSLLEDLKEVPAMPVPSAPSDATGAKKIELATEEAAWSMTPAKARAVFAEISREMMGTSRAAPPHEPPRGVIVS